MAVEFPRPQWEWVVADLTGAHITTLTTVGRNNSWVFRRNRPALVTLDVPSDDPRVNIPHTDGKPYVQKNIRLLKGYRLESGTKVLRFAGPILQTADNGGAEVCTTTLTAYSAEQRLYNRLCRRTSLDDDATGTGTVDTCSFTGKTGNAIAKALIDQTISSAGALPLDTGGTFATTSALPGPIKFEEGMTIGEALERLTGTETFDVVFNPIDGAGSVVVRMSIAAARGADRPAAIFGYGTANFAVQSMQRLDDGTQAANDVRVAGGRPAIGSTWTYGDQADATSIAAMGRYEAWDVADPAIVDTTLLGDLATAELALRKNGREHLTIVPNPEQAPQPFTDYFVGDTIHYHQTAAAAREALVDAQIFVEQIEGAMDDNGYERVTRILGRASL